MASFNQKSVLGLFFIKYHGLYIAHGLFQKMGNYGLPKI